MKAYRITYLPLYKNLLINTCKEKGQGCHGEILDATYRQMRFAVSKRRTLFCMFGLHFPKACVESGQAYYSPRDNKFMTRFIDSINKHFERLGVDLQYIWVREQNLSCNQHYHLLLLIDGNKMWQHAEVGRIVQQLWCKSIGFDPAVYQHLVQYSEANGIILQNDHKTFSDKFYVASYLAKTHQKGMAGRYREYGQSQLPKQQF